MKYKISNIALLVCLYLFACHAKDTGLVHSTAISTVVDRTDPLTVLPEAESILGIYGFADDKDKAASFRITAITDRLLNPQIEYNIPTGAISKKNDLHDDPHYREKVVLGFYEAVRKAISNVSTTKLSGPSLNNSECFNTIAKEIREISKSSADKKYLLVFSDIQEKSKIFDCYTEESKRMLNGNKNQIVALFDKTHLLPDTLKGLTVFFIYQPKNRQDDQQYFKMTDVYKQLLESRGAVVTIQATNNYQPEKL